VDEIGQAQHQLGRALDRARAGEDRALAGRVREDGERLAHLLQGVFGMARMHSLDNHAFDQPMRDLGAVLRRLLDLLGAVHLLAIEDQIYINDIRLRFDDVATAAELGARLRQHDVGGVSFFASLTDAQLRRLVACFAGNPAPEQPRLALQVTLEAAGLESVELAGTHRFVVTGEETGPRTVDLQAVTQRGCALVEEGISNLAANRLPNPLPLRRIALDLLEAELGDGLQWTEPENAVAYSAHTIRVCRLALLLGEEIGLSAASLQDLGVAALFHDVGYATQLGPREEGRDRPGVEQHGNDGARLLIKQRGFHEAKVRRVLATIEHHRRCDDHRGRPSLFGRILAIVEEYDTLTQPRAGGLSPDDALTRMGAGAGTHFDPDLLQLFINLLGRYPPKTLLRLADGRIGRVVTVTRGAETFDRPVVQIEREADGTLPSVTLLVDLAQDGGPQVAGVVAPADLPPAVVPAPAEAQETVEKAAAAEETASHADAAQEAPSETEPPAAAAEEAATTTVEPAPPVQEEAKAAAAATTDSAAVASAGPTPAATAAEDAAVAAEAQTQEPGAPAPPSPQPNAPPLPTGAARREPAAEMTARPLFQGVLPEILRDLFLGRKTGLLHLVKGPERRSIRFWKGNVVHASSNTRSDHLGEVAVREGLLSEADLARATEATASNKKRLGVVLRELGFLSEEQLENALAAHAREVILKAFPWSEGFADFEEQDADPSWFSEMALRLSTPDLIVEAVKRIDDPDVVRYHLGDLDRTLALSKNPAVKTIAISLTPLDGFVISRVDGVSTARDIIRIIPADPVEVQRSLFGLICIGLVEYVPKAAKTERT
jgi:hypothetical protein